MLETPLNLHIFISKLKFEEIEVNLPLVSDFDLRRESLGYRPRIDYQGTPQLVNASGFVDMTAEGDQRLFFFYVLADAFAAYVRPLLYTVDIGPVGRCVRH